MSDRLFFALWPEGVVRRRLDRTLPPLLRDVIGKAQRPDQWHVTLVFLGEVPRARQPALVEALGEPGDADAFVVEPFEIHFDRLEYWRKSRICCLTARYGAGKLADELRNRVSMAGFDVDDREFRTHLTLARQVSHAPSVSLLEPVRWLAERFALVRSVTAAGGSRYEPLRWWNLRGRHG